VCVLSRKPYRYLLGTILCSVLAYSQLLYYATEIEDGFLDITNAKTYAQLIHTGDLCFRHLPTRAGKRSKFQMLKLSTSFARLVWWQVCVLDLLCNGEPGQARRARRAAAGQSSPNSTNTSPLLPLILPV
jgi:hypothetical protein